MGGYYRAALTIRHFENNDKILLTLAGREKRKRKKNEGEAGIVP